MFFPSWKPFRFHTRFVCLDWFFVCARCYIEIWFLHYYEYACVCRSAKLFCYPRDWERKRERRKRAVGCINGLIRGWAGKTTKRRVIRESQRVEQARRWRCMARKQKAVFYLCAGCKMEMTKGERGLRGGQTAAVERQEEPLFTFFLAYIESALDRQTSRHLFSFSLFGKLSKSVDIFQLSLLIFH